MISFFLMTDYFFIVYLYHIFFIHQFFDGMLFSYVGIVDNVAINMEMHISLLTLRNEIAESYGRSIFNWGSSILFFIVAEAICIPANSAQEFPSFHILKNPCYFWSSS